MQLNYDQNYVLPQTASEMLASSDPHQKALLRILALSLEYGTSAVEPVKALAFELGRRRRWNLLEFAELLETNDYLTAINDSKDVFSPYSRLAIHLAANNGTLPELFKALHDRSLFRDAIEHEPGFYAKLVRLTFKVLFILGVLVYMFIKVIPEFKDMMDEFGVAPPAVFDLFVESGEYLTWGLLGYLLLLIVFAILSGSAIKKFFRRWSPTRWRQPIVSKRIDKLRAMALVCQPPNDLADAITLVRKQEFLNRHFNDIVRLERPRDKWNEMARLGIITPGTYRAIELTENDETRAWLLRWAATKNVKAGQSSTGILARTLFTVVNLVLAFLVALAAFAVFGVLISIMESLSV